MFEWFNINCVIGHSIFQWMNKSSSFILWKNTWSNTRFASELDLALLWSTCLELSMSFIAISWGERILGFFIVKANLSCLDFFGCPCICNYFCFTIKSNCLWDIISAFVLPLNSMFAKNLLLLHTSKNWRVSTPKPLLELPDRHFYLSAQKTWHIRSKIHLLNLQLHQFF